MAIKGQKTSEETKLKISKANLGKKRLDIVGSNHHFFGKKLDKSFGNKISTSLKGRKLSPEHIANRTKAQKGIKRSIETRLKISNSHIGVKAYNWKGGTTKENKKIRLSIEFRLWRESVFARDNWTCQKCNIKGKELHPHHILNFSSWVELRFAIDNGITLCKGCHREFHKKYGSTNNNMEQLTNYINICQ